MSSCASSRSRGDRPAALAAAEALASRLRRELGLAPSAETRALVEEVRRGRPRGAVPSPRAALPAPLARTARPLGRTGALERLEAAWGEARSAGLRLVAWPARPASARRRVVGELARRVHERGAAVLYGRCEEDPLLPYGPWVEALGRHLEGVAAAEREAWLAVSGGALACLLPGLAPVPGSDGGADERYLAFEAARGVLEQAAATHGLLLVVDDLHWADTGTSGCFAISRARASGPRRCW